MPNWNYYRKGFSADGSEYNRPLLRSVKYYIKHILHQFSPHNIRIYILQTIIGKDLAVIANCSKIEGKYNKALFDIKNGHKALIINNHFVCNSVDTPDYLIEA